MTAYVRPKAFDVIFFTNTFEFFLPVMCFFFTSLFLLFWNMVSNPYYPVLFCVRSKTQGNQNQEPL